MSEKKPCACRGRVKRALVLLFALMLLFSIGMLLRYYLQTRALHKSNDAAAEIAQVSIPSLQLPQSVQKEQPEQMGEQSAPPQENVLAENPKAPDEHSSPIETEPEQKVDPESEPLPEIDPIEAVVQSMLEVDIAALQEVNPEVLGWIAIPDTELSYPLVQTVDNQFYLNTTWDLQPNQAGAIYLECTNEPDLSEFHTIVYGHRWNDDSMFGSLKYYVDENYKNQHPYVFIVTADGCYRYEIFAAYEASVRSLTYLIEFESEQITRDFLNFCVSMSAWPPGRYLEIADQILTLSTCTGTGSPNRWVVQARLAETYPRS